MSRQARNNNRKSGKPTAQATQAGSGQAKQPLPMPIDVSADGIPDRAEPLSPWRLWLVFLIFAAWVAILIVCLLTGRPAGAS